MQRGDGGGGRRARRQSWAGTVGRRGGRRPELGRRTAAKMRRRPLHAFGCQPSPLPPPLPRSARPLFLPPIPRLLRPPASRPPPPCPPAGANASSSPSRPRPSSMLSNTTPGERSSSSPRPVRSSTTMSASTVHVAASPPPAHTPWPPHRAYAARMSFYRLKQFQCEVTGKSGLDYFQALESERQEARTMHSRFPDQLKAAVLKAVQWRTSILPSRALRVFLTQPASLNSQR